MDIFIEKIVKKRKDLLDYLIIICTVPVSVFILFTVLSTAGSAAFSVGVILTAVLGYLSYFFITSRNIEFEYALTNGELDIDKIIAKRKRKKLFSGNCRDFEIMAKASSEKHSAALQGVMGKIYASSSLNSENTYFFISQYKGKRLIVYFEPDDKIIGLIKTMNRKASE